MMTLTLTPDLEAALADQARRRGTTAELLALDTLRRQHLPADPPPPEPDAPPSGPAPVPPAEARNLAEFLGDMVGCIRSSEHVPGGAQMSTDSRRKFTEILLKKRRGQRP